MYNVHNVCAPFRLPEYDLALQLLVNFLLEAVILSLGIEIFFLLTTWQ